MKTILTLLMFAVTAHAAQTGPSIQVDAAGVSGSGFRDGRDIAILGAGIVSRPYQTNVVRTFQIVTADATGAFRWTSPEAISPQTIWFAIDIASLDFAAGARESAALGLIRLAEPSLMLSAKEGSDALATDGSYVQLVVIRPNGAVWVGDSMRNGSADLNRYKPGKLQFDLTRLQAVRTSNGHTPGRLLPADFVLLVDPVSLRYYAGRLAQGK